MPLFEETADRNFNFARIRILGGENHQGGYRKCRYGPKEQTQ
jgi:hypothetical protein